MKKITNYGSFDLEGRSCIQSLSQEDPLEEGMATHSSILAWRIPWTEEPGGLKTLGCKESDMTEETEHTCIYVCVYIYTHTHTYRYICSCQLNYKTLMKEIENDTDRKKNISCPWIGKINTVKMTTWSKAIYRFSAISIKLSRVFFTLEKTLMLAKTESKRRRGRQKMRWFDSITNSIEISLNKLWETVKDRGAWQAVVHGVTKNWIWLSNWTTTIFHRTRTENFQICMETQKTPIALCLL